MRSRCANGLRWTLTGLRAALVVLYVSVVIPLPGACQTSAELESFFNDSIGLSQEQIADIHAGKAVSKILKSRTPDEIFVFGAVRINAPPESYVQFASDFNRLRTLPEFQALGKFSNPPRVTDLEGFNFDSQDIHDLKDCSPRHCEIQMPAEAIEDIHRSIDWTAPSPDVRVNQRLHERAIERLQDYQRTGNRALGTYYDKQTPTDVPSQFEYLLSYSRALPRYLPEFHRYLLAYPDARPANVEDTFYWAKVKFGLKPTLRVVHVIIMQGPSPSDVAYAIAEKQLYSSHYFETALDLTFCVRDMNDPKRSGFYLIKTMGSEQAGLTGLKGSIVRKVAVGRTASSLERSLAAIKSNLEAKQVGAR